MADALTWLRTEAPRTERGGNGAAVSLNQLLSQPRGQHLLDSSGNRGGANVHTPAHVSRPAVLNDCRFWITESPLKADIASDRLCAVVIGAIGVDGWPQVLPTLQELGARSVVRAFDADEAGHKVNGKVKEALELQGYAVAEASWSGAKGIDDALVGGVVIRVS